MFGAVIEVTVSHFVGFGPNGPAVLPWRRYSHSTRRGGDVTVTTHVVVVFCTPGHAQNGRVCTRGVHVKVSMQV